jgi:hypothetical protein
MARFVLIKEVCPSGWLLWTVRKDGSCLRDFDALERRQYSTQTIEKWLQQDGNFWEMAPQVPVGNVRFWREQLSFRNVDSGFESLASSQRLLDSFKAQTKELLKREDVVELRAQFERWKAGFERVQSKTQFNHWDNDDATGWKAPSTGIGWSATMLERCRAAGGPHFVETGDPQLDFSLVSMELNLGISSRSNPFQPGKIDYIKPDGLGVRRAGKAFCVLEVKGPQDNGDLLEATLQALCGTLAVFAKRDMISRITRTQALGSRRMALRVRGIPQKRPSLGIYVLVAAKDHRGRPMFRWDERLTDYCRLILRGFPQLREIVYFKVEQESCLDFATVRPFLVIRTPNLRTP